MKQQIDIFIAFFRSGILGFGGGPSAIPLVHREVVLTYKWMNDEEFSDVLALANALPGPINTKMAGYIGWRISGTLGMLNALMASVLPTVLMMILFLSLLGAYKDREWVAGMSKAVLPVAGVMMGVLTWDFIKKSTLSMGWKWTIGLTILSLITIVVLKIHPAIIIFAFLVSALLTKTRGQKREKDAT